MSRNQVSEKKSSRETIRPNSLRLNAEIRIQYYAVSNDTLDQLGNSTKSSFYFDLSLFFISLSVGVFTSLLTTSIDNIFLFAFMISIASISFVLGLIKYFTFQMKKKELMEVIKKMKKYKCSFDF